MNPAVVLLLLRIASAILLLSFFGLLAWLIYRDVKLATGVDDGRSIAMGILRVVIQAGSQIESGKRHPLYAETTIGRAPSNSVVVDDAFASNEHARISRVGSQWWLEDLNSRNGTLLNEALIEMPTVVTTGDTITVGRTTLELELAVSE